MFNKLDTKSTIVIIFILLTFICLSQCKGGRGGGGSRSSSSGGSRSRGSSTSKGSGKGWFSSLFSSSGKTSSSSHNYGSSSGSTSSRNTGSSSGSTSSRNIGSSLHTYNRVQPAVSYIHSNQPLPGGVKPPPGIKQPYGPPPAYSRTNTFSNSNPHEAPPMYSVNPAPGHQSLGGYRPYRPSNSYHRTHYVSGYSTYGNQAYLPPPPPPPPGFINPRYSAGAAPSYTYLIDNYISRGSNSQLTAGLILWELSKHRSHYRVYHPIKDRYFSTLSEIPVNEEIVPGDTYIISPTDFKCSFTIIYIETMDIMGTCDTYKNEELRIVLPSNKTQTMHCSLLGNMCFISETFSKADMTPVDFKIFNETAVYGAPLCNTTLVNGGLEIAVEQYINGTSPCVYPPYKWTGEKWISLEAELQQEKIKENLESVYNMTKLEDKTLHTLARSMPFGKLFGLFYNATK